MSYTECCCLVYGVELTEKQEQYIKENSSDEEYDSLSHAFEIGDIGFVYSGHLATGYYKPVLGIVLAKGDIYEPSEVAFLQPSKKEELKLIDLLEKYSIEYEYIKHMLITYVV